MKSVCTHTSVQPAFSICVNDEDNDYDCTTHVNRHWRRMSKYGNVLASFPGLERDSWTWTYLCWPDQMWGSGGQDIHILRQIEIALHFSTPNRFKVWNGKEITYGIQSFATTSWPANKSNGDSDSQHFMYISQRTYIVSTVRVCMWFLHPPSGQYYVGNQQWICLACT